MSTYNISKAKPAVVIWGADNYNTLGILRSLSTADLDITFLLNGKKHGVTTASKYCKKYVETKNIEEGVEFLTKHFNIEKDTSKKAVLIPGGDAPSLGIAKNYKILNKRFHLMCTVDPNVLIKVTDKNEMGRIAKEVGLLVPISQEFNVETVNLRIPFPAIIKPVECVGRKEFKMKIIKNENELDHLRKILNPKNRYIIQEYINKTNDIIVFGCRLKDGSVHLAGQHIWDRWSDDGGGSYGHLTPEIPDYLNPTALKRFLEKVDYYGEFSAEYGFVNGKAYFYEVNFRNDGFCHLSFQAGANLPLLWVQDCLELPLTASSKMTKSMNSINEVYDVINVWRRNISWKQYKNDLKECEVFHFYDPNDTQPYRNMHKRMWWEIPLRAILKSFRPQIMWILNKLKL